MSSQSRAMIDRWVHFRIRDVFHPEPAALLDRLHGDDILQGRVIEMTKSSTDDQAYVVVEVPDMAWQLIVRVDRVLGAW
jgi:hypothetical protein